MSTSQQRARASYPHERAKPGAYLYGSDRQAARESASPERSAFSTGGAGGVSC
ncbi:hypothetical protein [Pararhodobacter zhoushanensis]|uniref:Uncharacterized protein n=1 Tax=Pararhodobacter zhoushanensis TaxID=2479545 RepID=A0ABT3H4Z7_9RHOB|nr:hypothetical protein [Pararhodobacter zhoushanensis]MCW1934866.1 hypothetical protein [Pararhodobacter zhoushanensis]